MKRAPLFSYFELLNIRQQLRELDPHIHDEACKLGIYAREFRLPNQQLGKNFELTR